MPLFDCRIDNTAVLLIDVQERFLPAIPVIAAEQGVGQACARLLAGATLLGLPILVSRQYPQGLGDTLPHLRAAAPQAAVFDKTHFSCLHDDAIKARLATLDREVLVLAGLEAHVCVLASAADALRHGYEVVVCSDAIASRDPAHAAAAADALRALGALVLPVESVLLRCLGRSGGDTFKAISKLLR
jgi:nicotinamidase-related amidase